MSVLPDRLRVLAVVPVYGHDEVTHDLLADLRREAALCDVVVVDNRGDYHPAGAEGVGRPGRNLGWAGGVNHGSAEARGRYGWLLWLNNDTRLSRGFVRGLVEAAVLTGAGVVAPFYDCHWAHQRHLTRPPVERYQPARKHYRVPFVDGTAMLVSGRAVRRVGLLDEETFAPLGWGAEIDYCLRAGAAGLPVVVTRQSYLHHIRAVTAMDVLGDYRNYAQSAVTPAVAGLERKWGPGWPQLTGIDPVTFETSPVDESARLHPVAALGHPRLRQVLGTVRRAAATRRDPG